jgi:hypothetical protein
LGSGSGVDAIVCLAVLNNRLNEGAQVFIHLVDRSDRQLELAEQLLSLVQIQLNNINVHITYEVADINYWMGSNLHSDIVLLNHVLTENKEYVEGMLNIAMLVLNDRGQLFITERERDPVWIEAIKRLEPANLALRDFSPNPDQLQLLADAVGDFSFLDITPHYVVAKKK